MLREKQAIKALNRPNENPLVFKYQPHRATIDHYLGCRFGCKYCYAFQSVRNEGWGAKEFAQNNVVYTNVVEVLEKELSTPPWSYYHGIVHLGDVQDCYQPIELEHNLTQNILRVLNRNSLPTRILTKSHLIIRDIELLQEMAASNLVQVDFSLSCIDEEMKAAIEPSAPAISKRLQAARILSDAGVPVGFFLKPVIPGITNKDLKPLIKSLSDVKPKYILFSKIQLRSAQLEELAKSLYGIVPEFFDYFIKGGLYYYPTREFQNSFAAEIKQICSVFQVPLISPDFPLMSSYRYADGIFRYRFPLIYDFVDLLKTHAQEVNLDKARELARHFPVDQRYMQALERYWTNGELFKGLMPKYIRRTGIGRGSTYVFCPQPENPL